MTDVQMYISVGLPTIAILIGILVNVFQYGHLSTSLGARISSVESALGARMGSLESTLGGRIASVESRLGSVETRLDLAISKLMGFDSRLSRVEERLDR